MAREDAYALGSMRRKDWAWADMYSGGRARDPCGICTKVSFFSVGVVMWMRDSMLWGILVWPSAVPHLYGFLTKEG